MSQPFQRGNKLVLAIVSHFLLALTNTAFNVTELIMVVISFVIQASAGCPAVN
jgi:hypothetical protein